MTEWRRFRSGHPRVAALPHALTGTGELTTRPLVAAGESSEDPTGQ